MVVVIRGDVRYRGSGRPGLLRNFGYLSINVVAKVESEDEQARDRLYTLGIAGYMVCFCRKKK
jgi:hypothetical protein